MDADIARALAADTTIDLTTVGRRSGELRRIEIWMLKVADRIVITGTPGPRSWYANLIENPECTIHLKERIRADVSARAFAVSNSAVRTEVFEHIEATWYRRQGEDLETLVAEAPMVELLVEGWPPPDAS
jgi:deazaflavin-dependent oxidoreductase (nitroreductase family)